MERAARRARLTLALVASGMFMAVLDTTIVNVALPAMRVSLDASVGGHLHALVARVSFFRRRCARRSVLLKTTRQLFFGVCGLSGAALAVARFALFSLPEKLTGGVFCSFFCSRKDSPLTL
jgi:MFS family permease